MLGTANFFTMQPDCKAHSAPFDLAEQAVRVAGQTTPANADGATLAKLRAKAKQLATQYRTELLE